MRRFKEEAGFTLLEMIIVIGLLGVAIGFTTFGLSTVYNTNVNAMGNALVSDIRLTMTKEMAAKDKDYSLELSKSGNNYYATMYLSEDAWASRVAIKTVKLSNGMILKKDNGSGSFVEVATLPVEHRTFTFEANSGKVTSQGSGRYELSSTSSTRVIEIVVVRESGRVYIDE